MNLNNLSVLLVEDSHDLRELFLIYLSQAGLKATCAGNTSEARTALALNNFDLIVSDIGLPEENGLTFLKALRSSNFESKLAPALAITAYENIAEAAATAGFDELLQKPFGRAELLSSLRSIAKLKKHKFEKH